MGQFHHDLVHMGDLPLVHPVLHLSILDAGILIMVSKFDDVLLEHGELPHVLPLAVHLLAGQVEGTILRCSYSLSFVVGPLLHA